MRHRYLHIFLMLLLGGAFSADALSAQTPLRLGGWMGKVSSRHLRDDGLATGWKGGFTVGAFLETETPLPFLWARVEMGYQGRGSTIWDSEADAEGEVRAQVTSHYLGAQIHGRFRVAAGPLGIYLFGGPTVEQLIKTGCTETICSSLGDGAPMVWGVAGGGGVEVDLPKGARVGLESRWEEGLSDSYRAGVLETRNRSRSVQMRLAFPGGWRGTR